MPTTIRDRSRGRIAWDGLIVVLVVVSGVLVPFQIAFVHDVAVSSKKTEKMTTLLLEGVVL